MSATSDGRVLEMARTIVRRLTILEAIRSSRLVSTRPERGKGLDVSKQGARGGNGLDAEERGERWRARARDDGDGLILWTGAISYAAWQHVSKGAMYG